MLGNTQQAMLCTMDAYPQHVPLWNTPKVLGSGDVPYQLLERTNRQKLLACRVAKLHMNNVDIHERKAKVDLYVTQLLNELKKERKARKAAELALLQKCGPNPNSLRAENDKYQKELELENKAVRKLNTELTNEVMELRRALAATEKVAKDSSTMHKSTMSCSIVDKATIGPKEEVKEIEVNGHCDVSLFEVPSCKPPTVAKTVGGDGTSPFQRRRPPRQPRQSRSVENSADQSPTSLRTLTASLRIQHDQMLLQLEEKRQAEGKVSPTQICKRENPLVNILKRKQSHEGKTVALNG
eukprot:Platyproteum_vivax@DN4966_c0_g1_i1.p1